jgi:hypothetical protein
MRPKYFDLESCQCPFPKKLPANILAAKERSAASRNRQNWTTDFF